MMTGATAVFMKTLRDFASIKILGLYLLPYTAIATIIAFVLSDGMPDNIGSLHLHAQEQHLAEAFVQVAFVWGAGLPAMVLVAVLTGTAIAREQQKGTLQILLSKPVSRWGVLLGKFSAIVVFTSLMVWTGLLTAGTALFVTSNASSAAVPGGIFTFLPGIIAYAVLLIVTLTAFGTAIAIISGRLLWTVLGTLVVPAGFFAFMFIRLLAPQGLYEDFYLYIVDINYHLGQLFVALHDMLGITLSPSIQQSLDTFIGVFDTTVSEFDPLVGGMATSVPLAGYVPLFVSVGILVVIGLVSFTLALYRFETMDIQ